MSSTHDRIKALVNEHLDLGRDPDFDSGLGDSGVSSVDAVAFIKKVGEAFGVDIPPAEVANFKNLSDLGAYLDANVG